MKTPLPTPIKQTRIKIVPKQRAIYLNCLQCSGDSAKEVTLCHLFDCPLWPYRCGYSIKSRQYKERMERAKKKFSRDLKDLTDMGIDISFFFEKG